MEYVLISKKRKKHQRAVNRIVRELNKSIENDELWRGRVVCRQSHCEFEVYKDGSGATLWVTLLFIDKKTGLKKYYIDHLVNKKMFALRLVVELEDFMIDACNIWEDKNNLPYNDKTDYRPIKI